MLHTGDAVRFANVGKEKLVQPIFDGVEPAVKVDSPDICLQEESLR